MSNYKLNFSKVKVMKDWGSHPIWVSTDYGGWLEAEDDDYKISKELMARFEYWSHWFDSNCPFEGAPDMDWDDFCAYGMALSIDLRRELGDKYTVIFGHGDKQVKLKFIRPNDCPIAITHAKIFDEL